MPVVLLPYTEFDLPPPYGPQPAYGTAPAGIARIAPSVYGLANAILPGALGGAQDVSRIEESPYAGVYALARRLAAGARSRYEVVARIQSFLGSGFAYDTEPPPSRYPLASFLLANHEGYCQQFSGAMTLMLRMDGIPARVAAGFLPGTRIAPGEYAVSARDAHAWVEVFFAGIGWVPFDPTPPAPTSLAGAAENTQLTPAERAAALHAGLRRKTGATSAPARGARSRHAGSGAGDMPAALLGAVLVALLLAGLWWARRRHHTADPSGRDAVAELAGALERLGVDDPAGRDADGGRAPARTLTRARRLRLRQGPARAALLTGSGGGTHATRAPGAAVGPDGRPRAAQPDPRTAGPSAPAASRDNRLMRHNPSYSVSDPDAVRALIADNPWTTLVSAGEDGLIASHYPVLLDEDSDGLAVVTHIGRPDEELHRFGESEVLLIFAGAHGYISPSWYSEQATRVPTWNFSVAHCYGTPQVLGAQENLRVLTRLVDHFERHVEDPVSLDQVLGARIAAGTVGLRVPITRFICKVKMNQEEDPESQQGVLRALRGNGPYADPQLARDMERALSVRAGPR